MIDTSRRLVHSCRRMTRVLALSFALAALLPAATGLAAPKSFDFKDPKGVNAVVVILDSPLEPVVATATGVSGSLSFDPAEPKRTTGKIVVAAGSVQFPNPGFTASARGPDGFDAERFPTIEVALVEVKSVRALSPSAWAATITGDFTCRGVKKRITLEAEATYLPGKAQERSHSPGDLLVLRASFKLRRRDFGIKPRVGDNLLGEVAEVRVAITGTAGGG
jgi:polyisoprenoid-binding protein YceI